MTKKLAHKRIPIVFLHGFMGTSIMHFGLVLKHWYKQYPLLAIDLPGHGNSKIDGEDHYFRSAIECVTSKIKQYQAVRIIGASYLGGTIGLRIALRYPELIKGLVLTGFTYDIPSATFLAWANSFRKLANNKNLAAEFEKLHGKRWFKTIDLLVNDCNRSYEDTALITLSMLQKVSSKTAIINGDYKDNEVEAAQRINKSNSLLTGIVIKGAGHIVTLDQPIDFCNAVAEFWE